MSVTMLPLFTFRDQCDWLRTFIAEPPSIDRAEPHEWHLYATVENLYLAGEIRLAVLVAWLSIIRTDDPTAQDLVELQRIIRNAFLFGRPELLACCLGTPGRAGGQR